MERADCRTKVNTRNRAHWLKSSWGCVLSTGRAAATSTGQPDGLCAPGTLFNARTHRCVLARGAVGKRLLAAHAATHAPPASNRTRRTPTPVPGGGRLPAAAAPLTMAIPPRATPGQARRTPPAPTPGRGRPPAAAAPPRPAPPAVRPAPTPQRATPVARPVARPYVPVARAAGHKFHHLSQGRSVAVLPDGRVVTPKANTLPLTNAQRNERTTLTDEQVLEYVTGAPAVQFKRHKLGSGISGSVFSLPNMGMAEEIVRAVREGRSGVMDYAKVGAALPHTATGSPTPAVKVMRLDDDMNFQFQRMEYLHEVDALEDLGRRPLQVVAGKTFNVAGVVPKLYAGAYVKAPKAFVVMMQQVGPHTLKKKKVSPDILVATEKAILSLWLAGYAHTDSHPGNWMLDNAGKVWILDLARSVKLPAAYGKAVERALLTLAAQGVDPNTIILRIWEEVLLPAVSDAIARREKHEGVVEYYENGGMISQFFWDHHLSKAADVSSVNALRLRSWLPTREAAETALARADGRRR